ncbi:MAG: hypothetical protein HYS18_04185 [Burkholderiales bacterium]|nr:hypothetical protein [Burkholderiales bacterium]
MENADALRRFIEEWCDDAPVKVNTRFIIPRSEKDRRGSASFAPPYFTEEGMVIFDRRENGERRNN